MVAMLGGAFVEYFFRDGAVTQTCYIERQSCCLGVRDHLLQTHNFRKN